MSDQIEDKRNPARVLEGDFADQCSLKASSIWERSILVQKVTVLLSWKSLINNLCFIPASTECKAIKQLGREAQPPESSDAKPPFWQKMYQNSND